MEVQAFLEVLGGEYFTGVPDSQLKALCNCLLDTYGIDPRHHLIAANEGNAAALGAGYHLATGKVPVVYLQNSGQGNILNPAASLLHPAVYGIPTVFVVGWRGEPGVHDEPQHLFQGRVTLRLLEDMDIAGFVLDADTDRPALEAAMAAFRPLLAQGKSVAFVVRKGGLSYGGRPRYENGFSVTREELLEKILDRCGDSPVVCTTGKASRELFELRQARGQDHRRDFLTVGSMGHSSSIALGIAAQKPDARVWCIDGDGAALMHLGAMGVLGASGCRNLVHVLVNNGAHETVGGMPTVASQVDFVALAGACGYARACRVTTAEALEAALAEAAASRELWFIEAACAIGSRADLGRPTTTPQENKRAFMAHLDSL